MKEEIVISYNSSFNDYEIKDDHAVFFIINRKNMKFEVIVDLDDLQRLIEYDYKWQSWYNKNNDSWYIRRSDYYVNEKGKSSPKRLMLHRWVINVSSKEDYVDHINHNTMDNRKCNLRITNNSENSKHRKGANKNNKTTGVRNVCYVQDENIYRVQIMKNGERFLWIFPANQFDEACEFAKVKRKELFGEFAGNG